MKLAFDDTGPFILICIDEIVHECIELTANPKFVLKNDLTQFLEVAIETILQHHPRRAEQTLTSIPPSIFSIHRAVRCNLSAVMI
jgi:hypothetical protein